jgi:hypothetical protein
LLSTNSSDFAMMPLGWSVEYVVELDYWIGSSPSTVVRSISRGEFGS